MRVVSDAVQEGAGAAVRRQCEAIGGLRREPGSMRRHKTIGGLSIVLGLLIYVLYAFARKPHADEPAASVLALTTTISFLFGALCSGVAGVVGMVVAVRSNIRTASAARSTLNQALQCAL